MSTDPAEFVACLPSERFLQCNAHGSNHLSSIRILGLALPSRRVVSKNSHPMRFVGLKKKDLTGMGSLGRHDFSEDIVINAIKEETLSFACVIPIVQRACRKTPSLRLRGGFQGSPDPSPAADRRMQSILRSRFFFQLTRFNRN